MRCSAAALLLWLGCTREEGGIDGAGARGPAATAVPEHSARASTENGDVLVRRSSEEEVTPVTAPPPPALEIAAPSGGSGPVRDWALAAREARRRGLDRSAEVQRRLRTVAASDAIRRDRILATALRAEVAAGLVIPEAEARAYWSAHTHEFTQPRFVYQRFEVSSHEVAEALVREASQRSTDVRGEGAGVLASAQAQPSPASFAPDRAVTAPPEGGGERLGPFFRSEIPAEFAPEVFTLREPGDRVVLERAAGIFVLELMDLRLAEPLSFEAVRAKIEARLRAQKAPAAYVALLARLRAEARVEVDAEAVAAFVRSEADAAGADPRAREAIAFRAKLERLQAQRGAAADSRTADYAPIRP